MAVQVATGVIQLFLHPPIGAMRLEAIPGGPFSGLNSHRRSRLGQNVDAFGIRYLVVGFPAGYGITEIAGQNAFDREVMAITVEHFLLDGTIVKTQALQLRSASAYVLFNESLPFNVAVEAGPGITYEAWWLLVL